MKPTRRGEEVVGGEDRFTYSSRVSTYGGSGQGARANGYRLGQGQGQGSSPRSARAVLERRNALRVDAVRQLHESNFSGALNSALQSLELTQLLAVSSSTSCLPEYVLLARCYLNLGTSWIKIYL